MKSFLICTFLILTSCPLLAQQSTIFETIQYNIENYIYPDSSYVLNLADSALTLAKKEKDNEKIAFTYIYLASYNYIRGEIKLSLEQYDKSIKAAKKTNNKHLIYLSKVKKAAVLLNNNPISILKKLNRYYNDLIIQKDTINLILCLKAKGKIFENLQKPALALNLYYQSLNLAKNLKNKTRKISILFSIARLLVNNGFYDKAMQIYINAEDEISHLKSKRFKVGLLINYAGIYVNKGNYDQAINTLNKTLKVNDANGRFPVMQAFAYSFLSDCMLEIGNNTNALDYANHSIQILRKLKYYNSIPSIYVTIAGAYLNMEQITTARLYLDSLKDFSNYKNTIASKLDYYYLQYKISEKEGNSNNALKKYLLYTQLKDSLKNVKNLNQFKELQVIYNTNEKEKALKEQKIQNKLLKKDNQLYSSRIIIIIVLSLILFMVLFFIVYLRRNKLKKKEQSRYAHLLIQNIDKERSRISKNLHDDIGQSLIVTKSRLQMYANNQIDDIDNLDSYVGEVIQNVRNLAHQLYPPILEKTGLKSSLISLLSDTERNTMLITNYTIDESVDKLSMDTKNQLYRITRECINNTLKHAHAKSILVSLEAESNKFIFNYKDNGIGFDINKVKGFGINTLKERTNNMNGKFYIASGLNKGVSITIIIPKT